MGEVDVKDCYSQLIAKSPSANLCTNHQAKSWLAQGHLECPLRHFLFESAYAKHDASGEDIKFTNATADFQGVIDYIFFPSCLLTQTKRLSVPSVKKEEGKESIIPTRGWPSDHVAIGAEFSFDD
eukprot:scaffold144763_cov55-Attheya_sp.AAC.2